MWATGMFSEFNPTDENHGLLTTEFRQMSGMWGDCDEVLKRPHLASPRIACHRLLFVMHLDLLS